MQIHFAITISNTMITKKRITKTSKCFIYCSSTDPDITIGTMRHVKIKKYEFLPVWNPMLICMSMECAIPTCLWAAHTKDQCTHTHTHTKHQKNIGRITTYRTKETSLFSTRSQTHMHTFKASSQKFKQFSDWAAFDQYIDSLFRVRVSECKQRPALDVDIDAWRVVVCCWFWSCFHLNWYREKKTNQFWNFSRHTHIHIN